MVLTDKKPDRGESWMSTRNVSLKTAAQESSRKMGEKIARIIDRGHENAAMSQEAHAHYGDKFTRTDAYVYFIRGVLTAIFQKPE
jgi:hypothetical protein